MSELINNAQKRRELLKHLIEQVNSGTAPEVVRNQLIRLMGQVPYADVLLVEQELLGEGLAQEDVLRLCDLHSQALRGRIDTSGTKKVPPGHPVDVFQKENRALEWELASLRKLFDEIAAKSPNVDASDLMREIQVHVNAITDVEKHYLRKENLLFPFLEKHEITGPSRVMWSKHDVIRQHIKDAQEALKLTDTITAEEAKAVIELVLNPMVEAVEDMILREEEILFPMSLDSLSDAEWWSIAKQSLEIGYCLYDPREEWRPEHLPEEEVAEAEASGRIQLPSGSFTVEELTAMLNTIPFDITFVDRDDTVRYFTQGKERIFARSRAILGRKVQNCHPPSSVHIVEKILKDFREGKEDHARFWINLKGQFVIIEYFALRNENGEYLGCLEVSQDLTEKRALEGEQRLLSYVKGNKE